MLNTKGGDMEIKIKMRSTLLDPKAYMSEQELIDIIQLNAQKLEGVDDNVMSQIRRMFASSLAGLVPKEYNLEYNRIIGGLMGATCYMPDSFEKLSQKSMEAILRIAGIVETNKHHSTFGHSYLTLEISGISKAFAMLLNNEHDYNTSEKSARYTIMKDIPKEQNDLYEKWLVIFKDAIMKKYPNGCNGFFDENGKRAQKLAQENARYMISIFNPTNMVYTTNFRQLNYFAHWAEREIANPSNAFYEAIKEQMQEFVDFCKNNNLFSDKLEDGKERTFQLFSQPILKQDFSSTFQIPCKMSVACFAQYQRHRTIDLSFDYRKFNNDFSQNNDFFIPPIIKDDPFLVEEYLKDIKSVASSFPQGTILDVGICGKIDDFILMANERLCACAQKEIRDLVHSQTLQYLSALKDEKQKAELAGAGQENLETYNYYITRLESLAKGSRCLAGYKCASPCGFKEGVTLESEI